MSDQIVMYGTPWCPDCHRARRFFDQRNISYEYINIFTNREAASIVEQVNNGNRSVPTIVFPDGSTMTEPSNVELEARFGTT